MEEITDRFVDEELLERFRRRLPRYRQVESFQEYDVVQALSSPLAPTAIRTY